MNSESTFRRFVRRSAPVVAAAAIGAGTGAGVYAVTSGSPHASSTTPPATAVVPAQPASTTQTTSSLIQLYKAAAPGVVDITVDGVSSSSNGFGPFGPGGGSQQTQAEGSGFVLDTKGDIVTNQHVVDGATSISVRFPDGKTAKATLVGTDKSTDIAVIKVTGQASELHPLTLGDSSTVQPGQAVAAIGSPFGLPGTMTAGIVSATGRTIQAPNNFSIAGAIQTDAAINHGNSGGPLIDVASGKVIGVNAQIESSSDGNQGVGFAIPINAVKNVASTIVAGGTVQHAYLGVSVTDAASSAGAKVACVVSGSPADKAGLQAGDVVTKIGSTTVTSADDLTAAVTSYAPNGQATMTIDRNGSTKTVTVTFGNRPTTSTTCS
jgi:putative serine protease PepD